MHKTILSKLILDEVSQAKLECTFRDYQTAWNSVSQYVFESKIRNRNKVHHATYYKLRKELNDFPSGLLQEARNDAIAKFKTIQSNKHKIDKAPKLKNVSIRYDKRSLRFKDNQFSISVSGNKGKRIKGTFQTFKFLEKHLHYKMLAPIIFKRDGEFLIGFTFEVPESPSSGEGTIGVDMGLRRLAVTSDKKVISSKELNRLRRKTRFLRAALQRKGTKSAKRHLKKIRRLEKRQSRDVMHRAANEILRTNANAIAIEDLDLRMRKFRKSSNRRRGSIPLSEFRRILEYKAPLVGKRIIAVSPVNTSLDDHRGLPRGKRVGCRYIGSDSFQMDADWNAACNIRDRALGVRKDSALSNNPTSQLLGGQAAVNRPIVGDGIHGSLTSHRL